jgi:hypothetical protein
MVDQTTDPQQVIKDKIATLQQQIQNAQQAGYTAGDNRQIPANVLNAPTQTTQPATSTFGASAGNTQGFQFGNVLQTAIDRMNTIQPLTQARQLLMKNIYDSPLSAQDIASLPPEYQKMVQTGDKQEMEFGLRMLNDQISNRTGTLDQSINYLTTQYTASQKALTDSKDALITHITDIQKQWEAQGYDPTTSLQKAQQSLSLLYSKDQLAQLGMNFPDIANITGLQSSVTGNSSTGYNFTGTYSASDIANAIKQAESGGASGAQGASGETGAFQFMPETWNNYSQEYSQANGLTGALPNTPENQQKVAEWKIQQWLNQGMQPDQIASMWNHGDPNYKGVVGTNTQTGVAYDTPSYVNKVMQQLGATQTQQPTSQPTAQYDDLLVGKTQAQQDYFNNLSPDEQSLLKQIIQGTALISDVAAGMGGAATRKRLLAEAQQIDPTFSENVNKRRYEFQKSWYNPTAKPFLTRTSINTAMGHAAQAYTDFQAIDNGTIQKYNSLKNMFSKETGNQNVINFQYDVTQLASEIAAAYKGGAPTDQETQKEFDVLTANMSPAQGKGVFDRAAKLMSSKVTSMAEEYKGAMGKYPDDPIVQDFALQELQTAGVDITPITNVLKGQGYDVSQYETGGQKFSIKAPDGNTYNFKDQSSLDKFKKEVGIQ